MLSVLRLSSLSSISSRSSPSLASRSSGTLLHPSLDKAPRPIGRLRTSRPSLTIQWRLAQSSSEEDSYRDDEGFALQYFARKPQQSPVVKDRQKNSPPKTPPNIKTAKTASTTEVVVKKVEIVEKRVPEDFVGSRLDRYISNLFPKLPNSRINKLLREKKITVKHAGVEAFKKVEGGERLKQGSLVKIRGIVEKKEGQKSPTLEESMSNPPKLSISPQKVDQVRSWIIHKDEAIIVLNKPPNLAVQGGTGIKESVDDLLEALQFEMKTKPKLIHRLDQGASGLLVLARDRRTAQSLAKDFATHNMNKLYWAICLGAPKRLAGSIKCGLRKQRLGDDDSERVYVVEESGAGNSPSKSSRSSKPDIWDDPLRREDEENDDGVKSSHTRYHTLAHTHNVMSMLALRPRTGRTHQLRVHCAQVLGTPMFGDYKYGPGCPETMKDMMLDEFGTGPAHSSSSSKKSAKDNGIVFAERSGIDLHLHAREIAFRHPKTREPVHFTAPVPSNFMRTMKHFDYNLMLNDNAHSTLLPEERLMKPYEFNFKEGKLKQKLRLNKLANTTEYQKERRREHALRENAQSAPKRLRARLSQHKSAGKLSFSSFKPKPKPKSYKKKGGGQTHKGSSPKGGRRR